VDLLIHPSLAAAAAAASSSRMMSASPPSHSHSPPLNGASTSNNNGPSSDACNGMVKVKHSLNELSKGKKNVRKNMSHHFFF
jgi:hypothetical protein